MTNKIISGLTGLLLAGSLWLSQNANFNQGRIESKKSIPSVVVVEGKNRTNNVPIYSFDIVPPSHCSLYVRLAAREIFGINMTPADAWNRRYFDEIVTSTKDEPINQLVSEGKVSPGMLLGIYNPKSLYKTKSDKTGDKIRYTHLALFLGTNRYGEGFIAHQFGRKTEVCSLDELRDRKLIVKEVLRAK